MPMTQNKPSQKTKENKQNYTYQKKKPLFKDGGHGQAMEYNTKSLIKKHSKGKNRLWFNKLILIDRIIKKHRLLLMKKEVKELLNIW